jgi:phosphopantetheinyl transferase
MPIFYQQDIDENTRLAIWKIGEEEDFFLQHVPLQREITHPHKRLQHLAGRYLLQYLFPDFPISLIKIADTRKPFLEDEAYHFSISHCSDYAAAIVSKSNRVGVDIEVPTHKVEKIKHKFLNEEEWQPLYQYWLSEAGNGESTELLTLLWSCKEAMFKWWGLGDVDFKTMLHLYILKETNGLQLNGTFEKGHMHITFPVLWKNFPGLVLAWVAMAPDGQTALAVGPN